MTLKLTSNVPSQRWYQMFRHNDDIECSVTTIISTVSLNKFTSSFDSYVRTSLPYCLNETEKANNFTGCYIVYCFNKWTTLQPNNKVRFSNFLLTIYINLQHVCIRNIILLTFLVLSYYTMSPVEELPSRLAKPTRYPCASLALSAN